MNGSEPRLPGLTYEEIDQLMDAQLSVADRMTTWQVKPLSVQARKVLQRRNSKALRYHYVTAQTCLAITLLLWLLVPFLPSSSEMVDIPTLGLSLHVVALSALCFGLFQAHAMSRAVSFIEEI